MFKNINNEAKKVAIIVIAVLVFFIGFFSIEIVKVEAGHVAVLVDKPFFFGNSGVRKDVVETGRAYTWASTQAIEVNIQPQIFTEIANDYMTKDGVPLDFEAIIRMQITDAAELIKLFGPNWYKNNIQKEFANAIRDTVKQYGLNEAAIDNTASAKIDAEVTEKMSKYIKEAKIPVRLIQITLGKANPPDSVKNQRIETAAQEQRVNTERQRKLAEDSRFAAEQSRASADNVYKNEMQLTTQQFVNLETLKTYEHVCGKEKSGCTFIIGSDAKPVINTGK